MILLVSVLVLVVVLYAWWRCEIHPWLRRRRGLNIKRGRRPWE